MNDIKTKIERLIDEYNLVNNQIGLCSLNGEYYEAAKIFQNNGIFPTAIVNVFVNQKGKKYLGIPVVSLKDFIENNSMPCVFIDRFTYREYRDEIEKNGYIRGKNLFVDFENKKDIVFLINTSIKQIEIVYKKFKNVYKKNRRFNSWI